MALARPKEKPQWSHNWIATICYLRFDEAVEASKDAPQRRASQIVRNALKGRQLSENDFERLLILIGATQKNLTLTDALAMNAFISLGITPDIFKWLCSQAPETLIDPPPPLEASKKMPS